MNPGCSKKRNQAMTLIELFVVVFILLGLIAVLWPQISTGRRHCSLRPDCSNNLKQLATAMKVWEGDNNDKYPMGISVTNGGTMELMETPEAWRAFQVMSNELSTPKILCCPNDSTRTNYTQGFGDGLKDHISYFISIVPDDSDPQSILSGDDNFRLNHLPVSKGNFNITPNSEVEWDSSRHSGLEYLMLADGSVQAATKAGLKQYIQNSNLGTNHFVIP